MGSGPRRQPLVEADLAILAELERWNDDTGQGAKPLYLGGVDRSEHSQRLRKMVDHRYVRTEQPKGQYRAARLYWITDAGRDQLILWRKRQEMARYVAVG